MLTLTVTPEDVVIIGNALGERPHKEAAALVQRLQAQINEQQESKPEPAPEPPVEEPAPAV